MMRCGKVLLAVLALLAPLARAQGPIITNLAVTAMTSSTVTIQWTTDQASSSQLIYGAGALNQATPIVGTLVTSHSITLTGLTGGQVWGYEAVSVNSAGHSTTSNAQQFEMCDGESSVTVSGTVNNYYEYGLYTITWQNQSGQSVSPTLCGVPLQQTWTGGLDHGASFGLNLPNNLEIVPSPSNWEMGVTGVDGSIGSFNITFSNATPSTNVTAALQAAAAGNLLHVWYDPATSTFYPPAVGHTTAPLTFNNSGSGAASGTSFNGSVAETISYNTVGAAPYAPGTGIPEITGGASWGTTYNASNQIPTNFVNLSGYAALSGAAFTGAVTAPTFNGLTLSLNGSNVATIGNSSVTNTYLYTPSLGTTPLTLTEIAGTSGTTAHYLVVFDGATGNIITASTVTFGVVGIALTTATSGQSVEMVTTGTTQCVSDGVIATGDLLVVGTSTAGRCKDSGVQFLSQVASNLQVVGRAQSAASAANQLVTMFTVGAGHLGASIVGASIAAGTITNDKLATAYAPLAGATFTGAVSAPSGTFNSTTIPASSTLVTTTTLDNATLPVSATSGTFSGMMSATAYNATTFSTDAIGVVTTGSNLYLMSLPSFAYGISANTNGGLDIMANQAGEPIRLWAGTVNTSPTEVASFINSGAQIYENLAVPSLTLNGGTTLTSQSSANSQVVTCPTGGTTTQYCDAAGAWVTPSGGTPGAYSSHQRASLTAPSSTSVYTMQGIDAQITPAVSGVVAVTFSGVYTGSSGTLAAGAGISTLINYGTGTAPSNGDANTGVTCANTNADWVNGVLSTATPSIPFSSTCILFPLTVGVTYWLDLKAEAKGSASTVYVQYVTVSAQELH